MAVTLDEVVVGDEPEAWAAAGWSVDAVGVVAVGAARIRLVGRGGGRRILGWTMRDLPEGTTDLDGLPTTASATPPPTPQEHDNGALAIDHVVAVSPDVERTTAVLTEAGIALRRSRDVPAEQYGFPAVQRFFRLGEPILELLGTPEPSGDGPASFFGLAFTVADLDALAEHLGPALGRVKDAVQPGRRIATLRHRELDISVATAFMSTEV